MAALPEGRLRFLAVLCDAAREDLPTCLASCPPFLSLSSSHGHPPRFDVVTLVHCSEGTDSESTWMALTTTVLCRSSSLFLPSRLPFSPSLCATWLPPSVQEARCASATTVCTTTRRCASLKSSKLALCCFGERTALWLTSFQWRLWRPSSWRQDLSSRRVTTAV